MEMITRAKQRLAIVLVDSKKIREKREMWDYCYQAAEDGLIQILDFSKSGCGSNDPADDSAPGGLIVHILDKEVIAKQRKEQYEKREKYLRDYELKKGRSLSLSTGMSQID